MAMLSLQDVEVSIATHLVCRHLNLEIEGGQCWGLLGRNGVGKTTLLHTLAGLRRPAQGELLLDGHPLTSLSRRHIARTIGVLLQDDYDPFPTTVWETALIGRHPFRGLWQWETEEDHTLAHQALENTDLVGMEHRFIDTLSGGERRRLGLATLLTQDPGLFLLDEPTNHLDLRHQVTMLETLTHRSQRQGKAMLMSLHDLSLVGRFCDYVLLLYGAGEYLAGPTAEVLTESHLERLYGHPLCRVQGPCGDTFLPL